MNTPAISLRKLSEIFDSFFDHPTDRRIVSVARIALGVLMLLNVSLLIIDAEMWFGPEGLLPYEISKKVLDPDAWSAFGLFSSPRTAYIVILSTQVLASISLAAGFFPRISALICLIGWTSINHRIIFLFDGEDVVFRLFCFFFILGRSDYVYSVHSWWRRRNKLEPAAIFGPSLPIRLVQLQFCLIYLCTAWEKANGRDWWNGSALYYVTRLDDLFGNIPFPMLLFSYIPLVKVLGVSVLIYEMSLPIALWIKELRPYAIIAGILFHCALCWTMVLFLFHPLMLVGLLSFVEPSWFTRKHPKYTHT